MSQPRWLTDQEQAAWRGFMAMKAFTEAELAKRLATNSLLSYSDYEVLVALTDQDDGQLRVMALADMLGWEKSRVSHQVTRMTNRGLVEKLPCDTDGRGLIVSITPDGKGAIEAASPDHVEAVRELFIDRLTPSQLDALVRMSRKVLDRGVDQRPTA